MTTTKIFSVGADDGYFGVFDFTGWPPETSVDGAYIESATSNHNTESRRSSAASGGLTYFRHGLFTFDTSFLQPNDVIGAVTFSFSILVATTVISASGLPRQLLGRIQHTPPPRTRANVQGNMTNNAFVNTPDISSLGIGKYNFTIQNAETLLNRDGVTYLRIAVSGGQPDFGDTWSLTPSATTQAEHRAYLEIDHVTEGFSMTHFDNVGAIGV